MVETILLPVRIPAARGVPLQGVPRPGRIRARFPCPRLSPLPAAPGATTGTGLPSVTTVTRGTTRRPPRRADPR